MFKPLLAAGLLASAACPHASTSPALATPPADPVPSAQGCRIPTASDYPSAKVRIRNHTDFARQHYPDRIQEFAQNPLECGDIVMLGDSLTERFDWRGAFAGSGAIRNRGIAGDTSDGVLARLGELNAVKPRAVFLMIGTNDLWTSNSPKKVASNIKQIIAELRAGSPETNIYLQTVLPLRSEPALNRKVREINALLVSLAKSDGVRVIDTHALLQDENGLLAQQFTDDGVHLTASAYSRWVASINQAIANEPI